MYKYTVILSLNRGTYISQVLAENEYKALFAWIDESKFVGVKEFDAKKKKLLLTDLKEESSSPVKLDGLDDVYCTTCLVNDELFLFNLIKMGGSVSD